MSESSLPDPSETGVKPDLEEQPHENEKLTTLEKLKKHPLDVVLVHGNGLIIEKDGGKGSEKLSKDSKMRLTAAYELWRRGLVEDIVLVGGHTSGKEYKSEAEAMKDVLLRRYKKLPEMMAGLGSTEDSKFKPLNEKKVHVEESSKDTISNIKQILQEQFRGKRTIEEQGLEVSFLADEEKDEHRFIKPINPDNVYTTEVIDNPVSLIRDALEKRFAQEKEASQKGLSIGFLSNEYHLKRVKEIAKKLNIKVEIIPLSDSNEQEVQKPAGNKDDKPDAVALSAEDGLRLRDDRYGGIIDDYYKSGEMLKKKAVEVVALVVLRIPGSMNFTEDAAKHVRS